MKDLERCAKCRNSDEHGICIFEQEVFGFRCKDGEAFEGRDKLYEGVTLYTRQRAKKTSGKIKED